MTLFLPQEFCLDPKAPNYADCVMKTGNKADLGLIKRKIGSGLLEQLRALHREGLCAELIKQRKKLMQSEKKS
ncbi:hypothetical protein PHMEG_00012160 [Phytophthora megakarya]|uniref:Uncharacterized protein n=1 Tax=Phytophthora megakarya TaxID=4795 RepID=A0A225W9F5_9STRA|nr:hypothetical protein PHMEG_00012160 [Phytophthora megakarya]